VKGEAQNASIQKDEGSASLVKSIGASITKQFGLNHFLWLEVRSKRSHTGQFRFSTIALVSDAQTEGKVSVTPKS